MFISKFWLFIFVILQFLYGLTKNNEKISFINNLYINIVKDIRNDDIKPINAWDNNRLFKHNKNIENLSSHEIFRLGLSRSFQIDNEDDLLLIKELINE